MGDYYIGYPVFKVAVGLLHRKVRYLSSCLNRRVWNRTHGGVRDCGIYLIIPPARFIVWCDSAGFFKKTPAVFRRQSLVYFENAGNIFSASVCGKHILLQCFNIQMKNRIHTDFVKCRQIRKGFDIGQLCALFQLSVSTAGDSKRCGKLRLTVSENPAQKFDIGCNFSLYRQIHSVPPVFCNLVLKHLFI